MPYLAYEDKRFGDRARSTIVAATRILDEYAEQGFDLTLRQLYYQFVARGLLENTERNYNRLGKVISEARLCGLVDWSHIIDRTRRDHFAQHWTDPAEIIDATVNSFRVDLWADQPNYVEVWIEKEALLGVITGVCDEYDVRHLACKGYYSQSKMWAAGRRLLKQVIAGKNVTILHLGDHDPSGIDMTRDIEDRLSLFIGTDYAHDAAEKAGVKMSTASAHVAIKQALDRFHVNRIALTMEQVEENEPPPNPAKVTDSRYESYRREYGDESWELDSLDPNAIVRLIRDEVEALLDDDAWAAAQGREREGQDLLRRVAAEWGDITDHLNGGE